MALRVGGTALLLSLAARAGRPAGTDIRISFDNPGALHFEHFGASDPTAPLHFLTGANDYSSVSPFSSSGVWASFDGGRTWQGGNLVGPYPDPNGPVRPAGDPIGDIDSLGNTYFGGLGNGGGSCAAGTSLRGLFLSRSTDGGLSFAPAVRVWKDGPSGTSYLAADKPWVSVDRNPGGPFAGRLYYSWHVNEFDATCANRLDTYVQVAWSSDHGATWSAPVTLPQPSAPVPNNLFVYTTVASDGSVYAVYRGSPFGDPYSAQLYVTRSTDGGATWSPEVSITGAPIETTGYVWNGYQQYPDVATGGSFRHLQFAQIAVSPTDPLAVYAIWNHASSADPAWDTTYTALCCGAAPSPVTIVAGDIAFARSADGGQTWSQPLRVNDDPPGNAKDQFFPAMAVSPDGVIHAVWLDRRDDPANLQYHVYYAASADGGLTWGPNQRVSDAPSDFYNTFFSGGGTIGEYLGLAASPAAVLPFWTDMRSGTPANEQRLYTDPGILPPPTDSDGDGVPDAVDCAPADGTVWAVPGDPPRLELVRNSDIAFSWQPPARPGTTVPLYDLLRSPSPSDFTSAATCVATAISSTAATEPLPAGTVFYRVRAKDSCGGNLGDDGSGQPMAARSCP